VEVVLESAEVAGLNAVRVINLGIGRRAMDAYAAPGSYEALLGGIGARCARDRAPGLRRVALSAWSAGYGAVSTILEMRRGEIRSTPSSSRTASTAAG
jgi:hypothetical protein